MNDKTNRSAGRKLLKKPGAGSRSAHASKEKRGRDLRTCLEESLQLQKRLRQLTHRVLEVQEQERTSISRVLQDEIAQTLLGINVRLLSLKKEARTNGRGFKSEIVSTQRLVAESARSVRRAARRIGGL